MRRRVKAVTGLIAALEMSLRHAAVTKSGTGTIEAAPAVNRPGIPSARSLGTSNVENPWWTT